MAKITLTRAKTSVTRRNAKYYLTAYLPYVSLLVSVIALLKAYDVII